MRNAIAFSVLACFVVACGGESSPDRTEPISAQWRISPPVRDSFTDETKQTAYLFGQDGLLSLTYGCNEQQPLVLGLGIDNGDGVFENNLVEYRFDETRIVSTTWERIDNSLTLASPWFVSEYLPPNSTAADRIRMLQWSNLFSDLVKRMEQHTTLRIRVETQNGVVTDSFNLASTSAMLDSTCRDTP